MCRVMCSRVAPILPISAPLAAPVILPSVGGPVTLFGNFVSRNVNISWDGERQSTRLGLSANSSIVVVFGRPHRAVHAVHGDGVGAVHCAARTRCVAPRGAASVVCLCTRRCCSWLSHAGGSVPVYVLADGRRSNTVFVAYNPPTITSILPATGAGTGFALKLSADSPHVADSPGSKSQFTSVSAWFCGVRVASRLTLRLCRFS